MKVEVDVLSSPSLIVLMVSVDIKAALEEEELLGIVLCNAG